MNCVIVKRVVLASMLLSLADIAGAAKFFVNDNANVGSVYTTSIGNDANAGTASAPFLTINKAISVASAGDTVYVDAGTYGEQVDANKKITILGANAAISPNTATRLPESILHNTSNNSITITTAAPVVIKGFRITTTFGNSIQNNTSSGNMRLENILFDACKGTYFNAPDTLVLIDNRFYNLDTASNDAVFLAGNYNGTTGTWLTATKNMWSTAKMSGMNCSNVHGNIYENVFDAIAYYGILVANYSSLNITRNTFNAISNPDVAINTWGSGVRFYTPVSGMTTSVTNNTFTNSYIGVAVRPSGGNMSGTFVNINNNYFSGNTYAAIYHAGTGQLDGGCNWLGLKSCDAGISQVVLGPVDYSSYLNSGNDNDIATPGFQPAANTCITPSVWTGASGTDWNTPANWNTGVVPGVLNYVTIPSATAAGRWPVITADVPSFVALSILPGGTLTQTSGIINNKGTAHVGGVYTQTGGTYLSSCNLNVDSSGLVTVSGSANLHMANSSATPATASVILASNSSFSQAGGTVQLADININSTNCTYTQSGGLLQIARDYINYGSYNATGGTIEWAGNSVNPVFAGTNIFNHVVIDNGANPGVSAGTTLTVKGNYTSTSYSLPSSSTTIFTGSAPQSVLGINSSAATFGDLIINKSSDTLSLQGPANVAGNTTLTNGFFNLGIYTSNRTASGGVLSLAGGTTLMLSGNNGGQPGSNYPSGFITNSLALTSTVIYNGSSAVTQTVHGITYGNLRMTNGSGSGKANKTSIGSITVTGSVSVDTGVSYMPSAVHNSTY